MPATKQQIRQIIADNNLNSVADVYSLLRGQLQGHPPLCKEHGHKGYPHDQIQGLYRMELSAKIASTGKQLRQKAYFQAAAP